ncbi:MAG: Ig domain-containing protein [Lachnospiraceae bacterium]|nr:Ig domain-containing protein [Lachnospiraceae bacterium]
MGLTYRVHRQTYGWEMPYKTNGAVSGTTGQSKRLEGIEIALTGNKYSGSIIYSTHVQSYGWMKEVSDGMMSGTSGESKRLESIKIRLEGEVADYYDIYYRVHAQSYGWLGWAKNGAPAGTAGYSKRLEAIQILLVEKGASAPTKVAGIESDTTSAFIDKSVIDTCNHNWVAQTKVVHHDAVGHMETKGTYIDANGNDYGANPQIVIAGGKECVLVGYDSYYICNTCGMKFYDRDYGAGGSEAALREHKLNNTGHGSDSLYREPIYVEVYYKEIAVFVEDTPAWDETVTTGYKCSICGDTK